MSDLAQVVTTAQKGNSRAFGQIVHRFQDMAFATAYSMVGDAGLAQDAAQEAFLDAYNSLPNLREPAAFPGWFRRIVVKHSDRQTRSRKATLVPIEIADLHVVEPSPEALLQDAIEREDVQAAIDLLPAKQRIVTLLFYIEGYSQKEIAAFLEIPVTAVKKRLYNARQNLKKGCFTWYRHNFNKTKPSQNDDFTQRVNFFTAVLDGDTNEAQALVQQNPLLLQETAEWTMAIQRHYWVGATALHLATSRGNVEMVQLLLSNGANDVTTNDKMTALHTAAIMKSHDTAKLLIEHGTDVNTQSAVGQTALHVAALRNDTKMARLLLANGAKLDMTDSSGHTPSDLAAIQGHGDFVILLQEHGAPLTATTADKLPQPDRRSRTLTTGIKAIDFPAPMHRGGTVGIFTPKSGVGFMVALAQTMRSVQKLYSGFVIVSAVESHEKYQEYWNLFLRESDADQNVAYKLAPQTASAQKRKQL